MSDNWHIQLQEIRRTLAAVMADRGDGVETRGATEDEAEDEAPTRSARDLRRIERRIKRLLLRRLDLGAGLDLPTHAGRRRPTDRRRERGVSQGAAWVAAVRPWMIDGLKKLMGHQRRSEKPGRDSARLRT